MKVCLYSICAVLVTCLLFGISSADIREPTFVPDQFVEVMSAPVFPFYVDVGDPYPCPFDPTLESVDIMFVVNAPLVPGEPGISFKVIDEDGGAQVLDDPVPVQVGQTVVKTIHFDPSAPNLTVEACPWNFAEDSISGELGEAVELAAPSAAN